MRSVIAFMHENALKTAGPRMKTPFAGKTSGRTALESVLVLIFMSIILIIAIDRYASYAKNIKETLLRVELSNLRTSINYYAAAYKKLPVSLKALVQEGAASAKKDITGTDYNIIISGRYVEGMSVDAEGYPLDPFGKRFGYDPETGMLRSGSPGYEKW